jgi:N-methylhydantoinase B/oxoprolinase/acetone carboxylase alpha subunit
VLDIRSGGGGGFGDPVGRSAEARARDLLLGFVTDGGEG